MASFARRRAPTGSDAALLVFYAACVLGYVRSQAWPGVGLLVLPALVPLALRLDAVGERLRRRGERDAWALVALTLVTGVAWTIYLGIGPGLMTLLRGVLGTGLVLMAGTFVAGLHEWRPERGLIPAGLALLALGGLAEDARMTLATAVATLGLVTWLARQRPTLGPPVPVERWRVVVSVGLSGALAGGMCILLPAAQPLVESAIARRLSGSEALSGLSDTSRLGDVESLAVSREVVLRVWSERPSLLRARVLTRFDGRAWSVPTGPARPLPPVQDPDGPDARRLAGVPGHTFRVRETGPAPLETSRVLLAGLRDGTLAAPGGTVLVRVPGTTPYADPAGVVSAPAWSLPELYELLHARRPADALPRDERSAALQLPDRLDPRLRGLAERLASGVSPDPATARADARLLARTLGWLGHECHYALDVGAFRTDQPIAEFLFDKKRGYCEYFASSAALLLRLQGVPTRLVTGFNVRDANRRGDHYLVRASDAHAWIEAWIDGVGWVEADPTPAAEYDAVHAAGSDGALVRAWETVAAFAAELRARVFADAVDAVRWLAWRTASGVRWALVHPASVAVLLVSAMVWLGSRFRRRHRFRAPPPPFVGGELAHRVGRLERRWKALGHPRPPQRPLLEHLSRLPDGLLDPEERDAARRLVHCYYEARFAGRPPDPCELTGLATHPPERPPRNP